MKARRLTVVVALALVTACSSHQTVSAPHKPSRTHESASALVTCKTTPVRRGAAPKWTAPAWSTSSPGFASHLRYVVSAQRNVVGVVFVHLRAGRPENPANKILWIVRQPRRGQPLNIRAQPVGFSARDVTMSWPADSSPGEIYPSIDNVPLPGCWRFTLRWSGHADVVALYYGS